MGGLLPNRQSEPIAQESGAAGQQVGTPPYHTAVALTEFFTEQQRRIRRISTTYIPRPSQFTPKPTRAPQRYDYDAEVAQREAPWHGSWYGYSSKRCRCEYCKRANASHAQRIRLKAKQLSFSQQEAV